MRLDLQLSSLDLCFLHLDACLGFQLFRSQLHLFGLDFCPVLHFIGLLLEDVHLVSGHASHIIGTFSGILPEFTALDAGDGLQILCRLLCCFLSDFGSTEDGVLGVFDLFVRDSCLLQRIDELVSENVCLVLQLVSQLIDGIVSSFRIDVVPALLQFLGEIFLFIAERFILLRIGFEFLFRPFRRLPFLLQRLPCTDVYHPACRP